MSTTHHTRKENAPKGNGGAQPRFNLVFSERNMISKRNTTSTPKSAGGWVGGWVGRVADFGAHNRNNQQQAARHKLMGDLEGGEKEAHASHDWDKTHAIGVLLERSMMYCITRTTDIHNSQ